MTILLMVLGLILLVAGAEVLVRGASRLALGLRIPPVVVGLTVVAFGTSAPELAVSTSAALSGDASIAVGNVVGSNVFNVLLILGLAAVVAPLDVTARLVRLDVPVMIGISALLLGLALDGRIGRGEGVLLLAGLAVYLFYLLRAPRDGAEARRGDEAGEADAADRPVEADELPGGGRRGGAGYLADVAGIVAGLVLLVLGSRWFVGGAREIAASLGVSDLVIGLTIVAGGTSLPELATSILASIRGQRDIAVGNVVGSNILNILAILGIAATVAPDGLVAAPAAVTFDIPVMTAVAVLCLPVFFTGGSIDRWEGGVFVAFYVAYTTYLVLDATGHEALPELRQAVLYFLLPMAVVVLVSVALRAKRGG